LSLEFEMSDAFRPDSKTSRFMALTGCDFDRANFCLGATNYDERAARRFYESDVASHGFQSRPPSEAEQQRELDTRPSVVTVVGVLFGFTAMGFADGWLAQLTGGLFVLTTVATFLNRVSEFLGGDRRSNRPGGHRSNQPFRRCWHCRND